MKHKISLFFSGELVPGNPLWQFCEKKGWDLTARSLLGFKPIPFEIMHAFDVVFISSIRSFNYFRSQQEAYRNYDYAVIGQSTASKVSNEVSSIVFIGETSGDPEAVARDFKEWLGDRRVLFPISSRSNETIARTIPNAQKEIVYCYSTELLPVQLKPTAICMFTSPSNAEAFLLKNSLESVSTIVAWGKTTEKKLVQLGYKPQIVLQQSSEESLVEALDQHFSG